MTNEIFLQASKIKDELYYLETGMGFSILPNYKEIADTIEDISIFSGKGHVKIHKEMEPDLFEIVKNYLEVMEAKKQTRIQELEKQFAEL